MAKLLLPLLALFALEVPPAAAADASAALAAPAAAASAAAAPTDYQRARYDALHFKPAIDQASDAQCLACHAEVLEPSVRASSPAGVKAATARAWYQQTSTYRGDQDTFHRRHLSTAYANEVMDLRCTTCHQGSDPRDKNPGSSATSQRVGGFTLRKNVVPQETCLKCHGQMNWKVMGLPDAWPKSREMFQNNCLMCHAAIRTTRHQVTYLKAEAIEAAASRPSGGDVCYGCHGGRAWYRTNYPYARHAWPGMDPAVPDWAKNRPTQSEARFVATPTAKP